MFLLSKELFKELLYLQKYLRLTIIHQDLKTSNVLLDEHMRSKYQITVKLEFLQKMSLKQTLEELLEQSRYIFSYGIHVA